MNHDPSLLASLIIPSLFLVYIVVGGAIMVWFRDRAEAKEVALKHCCKDCGATYYHSNGKPRIFCECD